MTSTTHSEDELGDDVAESVDSVTDRHPWLERLTQVGWIAKSVVYTLMGVTAFEIARQSTPEDASPAGSIGRVGDVPFGRVLLVVLVVGLLLYSTWRFLSVAVISGNGWSEWGDRIGYTFSAVFYLTLAWTAGIAAAYGAQPDDQSSVEKYSQQVLEMTGGRVLVGIAGAITIGVGIYFTIHKGIQRSFADDLDGVEPAPGDNPPKRHALVIAGIVGWIGRGIVTVLVGFFVLRSAIRFDPDDAAGFDRALRRVADSGLGTFLVFVAAVGLIAYGVFCSVSYRFRSLDED